MRVLDMTQPIGLNDIYRKIGSKTPSFQDGFIFTSIASATKYVKIVEC